MENSDAAREWASETRSYIDTQSSDDLSAAQIDQRTVEKGATANDHGFDASPRRSNKQTVPGSRIPEMARHDIIGSSQPIKELRERIALYGPQNEPVLICGETGVGKEGVAQALHFASQRSEKTYVVRNVGRVDSELIGSDFFGHERGAFTGALQKREGLFSQANGGTLHLDEIGELPMALQANLLRVIEDGVVTPVGGRPKHTDVRLIAATNKNLLKQVETGEFREDLFYRLDVLRIDVPPLRDRGDDVIEISEYWLARRSRQNGEQKRLTQDAMKRLLSHHWPGNVRELRNVLFRGAVLAKSAWIDAKDLVFTNSSRPSAASCDIDHGRKLLDRYLANTALQNSNGNVSQAARCAKMNRTSFHKLKEELEAEGKSPEMLRDELKSFLGF